MPHVFDSGQRAPIRTLVRDAVVQALAPLRRASGLYLAAIVPLPMTIHLETDADEQMLEELVLGQSPAVAVAVGAQQFKSQSPDRTQWAGELEVVLYALTKNQRSAIAGLAGDAVSASDVTRDPGIETILEHCLERVAGIEANGSTLILVAEEPSWFGAGWMIWQQRYRVATQYQINPGRSLSLATAVEAEHQIDEGGTPVTTITTLEISP